MQTFIIVISSVVIIGANSVFADENSGCLSNQFYYFGKCYPHNISSVPASTCGMFGTKCASIPCPKGFVFAPNYTNGIRTGFLCANLSNCPSGTIFHDNACIAIETDQFNLVKMMGGGTPYALSPLKLFKSGVAIDNIKCFSNLELVIKSEDGSPACVTSQTATKLIQSGWAKNHTGIDALGYPPVQLLNVTTSPQPIILGIPFYVNAIVVNHQTYSITYYGGCVYPLSVSFDNIKTYTNNIHCLAISKNILGPNEQATIHSERIGTLYNATGSNATTATIKFSYEVNGNQTSFFTSKQFSIQHE